MRYEIDFDAQPNRRDFEDFVIERVPEGMTIQEYVRLAVDDLNARFPERHWDAEKIPYRLVVEED